MSRPPSDISIPSVGGGKSSASSASSTTTNKQQRSSSKSSPMSNPSAEHHLPFRETLLREAQMSECDYIDLEFLGSIQGGTANVLFLTHPQGIIVAMDANFPQKVPFMRRDSDNDKPHDDPVIGKAAKDYLPATIHNQIQRAIADMQQARRLREFVFAWHADVFYSICVTTTNSTTNNDYSLIGLEVETLDEVDMLDLACVTDDLSQTLRQVSHALDFCTQGADAAKVACKAIFDIVGRYDRGMVYYFHDDLSGEVIYEVKKDHITSSYYGMHFPAADIPQSARLLYVKNVVRYIYNVDGQDVPIVSSRRAIDLTQTRSRCVHKCHLLYCKGMGIVSGMSLAIVSNNELWGLISFHGYATPPFKPTLHQLIACETIASYVSARVVAQYHNEQTTRMLAMGQVFRKWNPTANVIDNLNALGDDIAHILQADVLAARYKGEKTVWSVAKGDMTLLPRGLFWSKMSNQVPMYGLTVKSAQKSVDFGLSDVNYPGSDLIYINADDVEIMLGRSFRTRDVVWGGNPDAPKLNIGGLLHPRASFEAQLEKAKKDAHPFDTLDQKLAGLLRDLMFNKESNSWVLQLMNKDQARGTLLRSFNALDVAPQDSDSVTVNNESSGNQLAADLGKYLQTLDLIKPKRWYLSPPKACNQVIVQEFANQSVAKMRRKAEPTQLDFKVQVDRPSKDRIVTLDHTKVSQIVANVINYSMELAGPIGKVEINFNMQDDLIKALEAVEADVSAHKGAVFCLKDTPVTNLMEEIMERADKYYDDEEDESQKWFCFSVSDTGSGMLPEQLVELFQSVKQANKDTAGAIVDNTKLGISVSVELCRRLGGFMACLSTPYQGSVFYVAIPVQIPVSKVAPPTDDNCKQQQQVAQPIIVSGLVLIVGDNDLDIEQQIASECQRMGKKVEIVKARDGREAISAFSKEQIPSVMIIDHNMPGMDGLETMSVVRQMEYERNLQPSYIVSYTADVTDNVSMLFLAAGGNEVMVNPPPKDFVSNLVRRFEMESSTASEVLGQILGKTAESYVSNMNK